MILDCEQQIAELVSANLINEFGEAYLSKICQEGLDDELWKEAIDDMLLASQLGVSNEDEFRLFFYIDHFAEDLVDEIFGVRLSASEELELKQYMFSLKDKVDFNNLVTFRVAVLKWLQSHNKLEKDAVKGTHHRSSGGGPYYLKRYNMEYWARLVTTINKALSVGIPKQSALREAAKSIEDNIERLNFLAWYNFKFGSDKKNYNLNKDIRERSEGVLDVKKAHKKEAGIYEDALSYYVPKEVFNLQKELDSIEDDVDETEEMVERLPNPQSDEERVALQETLNLARSKMVARTFAIDKLLEKYREALSGEQIDAIEDAIHTLRKQIRKLKLASTMQDYMVRTANVLSKQGFEEGAVALKKIAGQHQLIEKTALKGVGSGEINNVIDQLTEISTFLKQRAIVRELAEADLALYNMDLAPMFPELTEASSKLIDAFTYASNKVDDILPKIRGAAEGKPLPEDDKGDRDHKHEKGKEGDIPLAFPKETDLEVTKDEPKKPKNKDKGKDKPKEDLNLESVLPPAPKKDLTPPKPSDKPKSKPEKPQHILELEQAIKGD